MSCTVTLKLVALAVLHPVWLHCLLLSILQYNPYREENTHLRARTVQYQEC